MAACEDPAGFGLLRWAVGDALTSAALATPALMLAATPCQGWNLRELLDHLSDSLDAVREAITCGRVGGPESGSRPESGSGTRARTAGGTGTGTGTGQACDPVSALRAQAAKLLAACATAPAGDPVVTVGGLGLPRSTVAEAGAVEVAVHGWDIRMACGDRRPVPSALADDLLALAILLVPAGTRHGLFADPVPVPRTAGPGDRLVAFLGRRPPLLWGDGHSAAG